jgi:hypothetical protein
VPWADGDRSCARFQRLRIFAWCIIAQCRGFRSGIDPAYFSNKEPISSLGNCLNVSGIVGVIVQCLPQLAHRHPEAAVKINERIVRPEAASKFLPADNLSGVFQKRDEQPTGQLLQPDASPVLQEFPRGGVYLKRAELIDNSGMCLHTLAPRAIED